MKIISILIIALTLCISYEFYFIIFEIDRINKKIENLEKIKEKLEFYEENEHIFIYDWLANH